MTEARRRRQSQEISEAFERGDLDRAKALAFEHLIEFPEDEPVWRVLERVMAR